MKDSVLIIDDEAELRSLLSRLISLEGYKVQSWVESEEGKGSKFIFTLPVS